MITPSVFSALERRALQTATLIYNPIAGRKPARRELQIQQASAALSENGIEVQLARTTGPGCATELARAAIAAGAEMVLVCGGDGTIHEVLNGVCPSRIPLGILPGGTANIVANELGLPHDPAAAARALPKWKARRIAVGLASGRSHLPGANGDFVSRYFLSVAGLGFDAYIVHRLSFRFKMSLGVAAYVIEGLRQLMHYSFPRIQCQADGQKFEATFALVQRTRLYAGWFATAPKQSLSEPQFSLSLFQSRRRLRYLAYGAAVLAQRQLHDVSRMTAFAASFEAVDPAAKVFFELDGELAGILPATLSVVPDALTLLMP